MKKCEFRLILAIKIEILFEMLLQLLVEWSSLYSHKTNHILNNVACIRQEERV